MLRTDTTQELGNYTSEQGKLQRVCDTCGPGPRRGPCNDVFTMRTGFKVTPRQLSKQSKDFGFARWGGFAQDAKCNFFNSTHTWARRKFTASQKSRFLGLSSQGLYVTLVGGTYTHNQ